MKAVILAGGRGSRLAPITDTIPKPLVPLGGVPVICRILRHLAKHGVDRAVITTGYLSEKITEALGGEYAGISLTYRKEDTPLGTAGSVAAVRDLLGKEDFLVVSGDAITEGDLSAMIRLRKETDADGVLLLSAVSAPGEFGVVLTDGEGRITDFCEKPSVSSTFSDKVNTGIYCFSPRILDRIPPDQPYDFGKQLLPALLAEGRPLYALYSEAYWCDIGSPATYLASNMRYTGGKSAIGDHCSTAGADLEGSVLMNDCTVGPGSRLIATILCEGVTVGDNCTLGAGCVIGAGSVIGSGVVIGSGIRLPAGSVLKDGDTLHSARHHRDAESIASLFNEHGLSLSKEDCTVSFGAELGRALSAVTEGGSIGVMWSPAVSCQSFASSLMRGIHRGGSSPVLLGEGFPAAASYAPPSLSLSMAVFIEDAGKGICVRLYDSDGLYPNRETERTLCHTLSEPVTADAPMRKAVKHLHFTEGYYFPMLTAHRCPLSGLSVTVTDNGTASSLLKRALYACGGELRDATDALHFTLSPDGFSLTASQGSAIADDAHIKAILIRYLLRGEISLPAQSPSILFHLGGGRVHPLSHCPGDSSENLYRRDARRFPELYHGAAAALELSGLLAASGRTLADFLARLPAFVLDSDELITDHSPFGILPEVGDPALDGVVASYAGGNVRIVPGSRGFRLTAEAASGEYAREILSLSKKEILRLLSRQDKKGTSKGDPLL